MTGVNLTLSTQLIITVIGNTGYDDIKADLSDAFIVRNHSFMGLILKSPQTLKNLTPVDSTTLSNRKSKMILKFLLGIICLVQGEFQRKKSLHTKIRDLAKDRRSTPICDQADLPLQPFSSWDCVGTPERCEQICDFGFERSEKKKWRNKVSCKDRFETKMTF